MCQRSGRRDGLGHDRELHLEQLGEDRAVSQRGAQHADRGRGVQLRRVEVPEHGARVGKVGARLAVAQKVWRCEHLVREQRVGVVARLLDKDAGERAKIDENVERLVGAAVFVVECLRFKVDHELEVVVGRELDPSAELQGDELDTRHVASIRQRVWRSRVTRLSVMKLLLVLVLVFVFVFVVVVKMVMMMMMS